MDDPRTWRDPEHGIAIDVPASAPSGAPVEVTEVHHDDGTHRLHAQTGDRSEVYVEVLSFPGRIDHRAALEDQRASLAARDPGGVVGPLRSDRLLDRPATGFEFDGVLDGQPRQRRFVLVDLGPRTVRVVSDPSSVLNEKIVATLRVTTAAGS